MTAFRVGLIDGPPTVVDYGRPVSFGILRSELDDYLLRRAKARLCLGATVSTSKAVTELGWSTGDSGRPCWWRPAGISAHCHDC